MNKRLLVKGIALLSFTVSVASANVPEGVEAERPAAAPALQEARQRAATGETSIPAPFLDGLRLKSPLESPVYLIMHSQRRHIPSPAIYNALFKPSCTIAEELLVTFIDAGPPLTDGVLLQAESNGVQYLYAYGHKHHITSPGVMVKFCFDATKMVVIKDSILAYIPDGPPLV